MSLRDLGGVFSRFFVVGFFVPAFLALATVMLVASSDLLPGELEKPDPGAFAVIGVAAVALGLVLLGLNYPIQRLLEGYGFRLPHSGLGFRLLRWIGERATAREVARHRRLLRLVADRKTRPAAARIFERQFPHREGDLLPTRLGNAMRAFERHGQRRWGLDAIAVWPHVEALMTDAERQAHEDDQGSYAFFLNGSVCALGAGLLLALDALLHRSDSISSLGWIWMLPLYVAPFVASYLLYRGAVVAAQQWGSRVRASVDLHRLDLYRELGLKVPKTMAEEVKLGAALTSALVWGETGKLDWFRDPDAGRAADQK